MPVGVETWLFSLRWPRWTPVSDLVNDAMSGNTHYLHQEDSRQKVRIWA